MWADGVSNVRSLAQSPGGTVFAGTWNAGNVYALRDENKDGKADRAITIISGLRNMPNGVAFRDGALYVAEINRIIRFDNIESKLENAGAPAVVTDKLPSDRHHGWKFIRFGPDGLLYVPVGAPCNMCDRGDPYAAILRMKPDGSGMEVFARGVRNTVGFDWHPTTRELWFTDNGRDNLGDNTPGDELNRAPKAGHAFRLSRIATKARSSIPSSARSGSAASSSRRRSASSRTPARSACASTRARSFRSSIATRFSSPSTDRGTAARHCRSTATASRSRTCRATRSSRYEPFATGWLEGRNRWGRPGRSGSDAGRIDAGVGRSGGSDLQDYLRGKIDALVARSL